MATEFKRIVNVILCAALFITVFSGLDIKAHAASINGHEKIADSGEYELYMLEDDLSIIVKNKNTGALMESAINYDDGNNNDTWLGAMKSAVVLTLIYENVDTQQADLVNDEVTKTVTKTSNGFKADLFWTKWQVGLTLEVALEGDSLIVNVPNDSIVEKGDKYQIGTISLYPFMGHTYLDEKEGYMYIPDGNGALIYLDDKEGRFANGYTSMIYGDDTGFDDSFVETLLWDRYSIINDAEMVLAPTFGMAHTSEKIAYLGIVENGAERASIVATPNGANVDYNRIFVRFLERKLYTQPTSNNTTTGSLRVTEKDRTQSDLTVRYIFLTGEDADYVGMATAYRNYLFDNNKLETVDTSYRTRIDFLGNEREEWVVGTTPVVMTTVDDIYGIYDDLDANGVKDILSLYKGWQRGGLYNLPLTKYKAASQIGGNKALVQLVNDAQASNKLLYLYTDALRINPKENNATFNIVKKINKKKYEEKTYKDVYENFNFLTPDRSSSLLQKLVSSINRAGLNKIAVSGISNTLFSYSYNSVYYQRLSQAKVYDELIGNITGENDLVLEQPFAYLWKYTDAFADMPLYDSEYIFEDTFIPFLSIVLKGVMPVYSEYVNFEANKVEFFLKMIETGTYPSFYITSRSSSDLIYTNSSDIYSSEYSVYKDQIIEYCNELSAISKLTEGAFITGHDLLDGGITRVTYDNGVKIYINYGEKAAVADGITLDSMTYKVVVNE